MRAAEPDPQPQCVLGHRNVGDLPLDAVAVDTGPPAARTGLPAALERSQNTTVVSPSRAASVIATPNSTVRTIVSATIWAGCDNRSPGCSTMLA